MFLMGPDCKEIERKPSYNCLHRFAVVEMVAPIYRDLLVLTYGYSCFNVGLLPSISFRENSILLSTISQA